MGELTETIAKKTDSEEAVKRQIRSVLIKKRFYNPYNVFNHEPEFFPPPSDKYACEVRIVKWNTRSERTTVLLARWDVKKLKWILSKKAGQPRTPHGEKMR